MEQIMIYNLHMEVNVNMDRGVNIGAINSLLALMFRRPWDKKKLHVDLFFFPMDTECMGQNLSQLPYS